MNVLQQILDNRDDERRHQDAADEAWLRERAGIDTAERLQSWDRWAPATGCSVSAPPR